MPIIIANIIACAVTLWMGRLPARSIAANHAAPTRHHAPLARPFTSGHIAPTRTFDVTAFGAVGDRVTDDTGAIQRAIGRAQAVGGGTVYFPARTYLLNSNYPSRHPWMFYNLIVGSNVVLAGQPGARLLQGPAGRHALPSGATEVRNTMLAFGPDYATIRFQNPSYNGGFYSMRPTYANSTTVTLSKAREITHFRVGDYVAIYSARTGDVIPTETSRIISVDHAAGVLTLEHPLARSFSTPSIANISRLATTNIGVKNLIVQGSEPLSVTEAFGFTAANNRFVFDTSIGGSNVIDFNLNTINGFRFSGNQFISTGPSFAVVELPQRNSQHGVFKANTFDVRQMGMGEYAAHWRFINNRIVLHPDARTTVGLAIGGYDIDFINNDVQGGNLTNGGGFGSLIADYLGLDSYAPYVGKIRIANNSISCRADGNACLGLFARDTVVSRNTIIVRGSGAGIHAEGPLPQSLTIRNNRISLGSGNGIVIVTKARDGSTISDNAISGAASAIGIFVASPKTPNSGGHIIKNNVIRGCRTHVFIDLAKHPGSIVSSN